MLRVRRILFDGIPSPLFFAENSNESTTPAAACPSPFRRHDLPATVLECGGRRLAAVTQEELKMTSEPKAPGAPAIYLYRQVDRKEAGRTTTEFNYVRIKILTEEGRKYANVEIPYSKAVTGINGVRARTIHADGSIVNFDGKIFENAIAKSKTQKYLAKTFTMTDVQVGSIIEYRYTYDFEDSRIFFSNWLVSEDLFTKKAVFFAQAVREIRPAMEHAGGAAEWYRTSQGLP